MNKRLSFLYVDLYDSVAESVKMLSLRLAANIPTVPAQKIDNIWLNLTVLVFVMIKANFFNELNGFSATLC